MLGFRKVRYANIPADQRDIFERYGETVIQLMVAASHQPRADDLRTLYPNEAAMQNAAKWLTERTDKNAKHERHIECVEWAILIFVVVGIFYHA
jgi:hypothetical protein